MTIKMTKQAAEAARSLAIAYDAFNEARRDGRQNGIAVWGETLIKAQADTGIALYDADDIRSQVNYARKLAA